MSLLRTDRVGGESLEWLELNGSGSLFRGLLLFELAVAKSIVVFELQCGGRVAVDLNLAFGEPLLYLPDHGLELNESLAQRRAGTLKSVIDQVLTDPLLSMSRLNRSTKSHLWL